MLRLATLCGHGRRCTAILPSCATSSTARSARSLEAPTRYLPSRVRSPRAGVEPWDGVRDALGRSRLRWRTHQKLPCDNPNRADRCALALAAAARFVSDSALEGTRFQPSVPRKASGVVVMSVAVRAEFSVGGGSSRVT